MKNTNIELIPVKSELDIATFAKLKTEMVHYHKQFADSSNIKDTETLKYTEEDSISHLNDENYFLFLIKFNKKFVGILEYKNSISDIKDESIVYVNSIYILEKYQGNQIGKNIIEYLKERFGTVELKVYYNLPAKEFYKHLGFKEVYSKLVLE